MERARNGINIGQNFSRPASGRLLPREIQAPLSLPHPLIHGQSRADLAEG